MTSGRCDQIEIFQFACRREFNLNYNESRIGGVGGAGGGGCRGVGGGE